MGGQEERYSSFVQISKRLMIVGAVCPYVVDPKGVGICGLEKFNPAARLTAHIAHGLRRVKHVM